MRGFPISDSHFYKKTDFSIEMKRTRADRRRQQKRKTQRKLKKRQLGGQGKTNNNRRGLALAMTSSLANNRMRRERQCNNPDYCPEGGKHEFEKVDVSEWGCVKCGCTLPYKPSVRENRYASSARAAAPEKSEREREEEKKEKEEQKKKKEEQKKKEKEEEERKERKRELKEAKQNECTIM